MLVSETRSEFATGAKGSVLVWLVLAVVPYSCGRRTAAPEPILVSLDPEMSPFLVTCHLVLGVDWKLPEVGQKLLGCLFHVT